MNVRMRFKIELKDLYKYNIVKYLEIGKNNLVNTPSHSSYTVGRYDDAVLSVCRGDLATLQMVGKGSFNPLARASNGDTS